jgi:hypothetical protein
VEGQFIYSTAIARHVLPFILLPPSIVILPAIRKNGELVMRTPDQLRHDGFREMAKWMERVEAIWLKKREKKAEQTATEWLDYQGKLVAQNLTTRHFVLYNASGTDMSATRVDRTNLPYPPFVVDHKLYWLKCDSPEEAHYITAILNSQEVNERIKPFQSVGIFGERDIHKKVLDLPIPIYNERNMLHRKLCELGENAEREAQASMCPTTASASLGRRRVASRKAMLDTLEEINDLVKDILG